MIFYLFSSLRCAPQWMNEQFAKSLRYKISDTVCLLAVPNELKALSQVGSAGILTKERWKKYSFGSFVFVKLTSNDTWHLYF